MHRRTFLQVITGAGAAAALPAAAIANAAEPQMVPAAKPDTVQPNAYEAGAAMFYDCRNRKAYLRHEDGWREMP